MEAFFMYKIVIGNCKTNLHEEEVGSIELDAMVARISVRKKDVSSGKVWC